MPINSNAMIGPMDASPIIPYPSRSFLHSWTEQRPIPSDRRIGTVMGPVVTPPESSAIPMNSGGAMNVSISVAMYPIVSSILRLKRNTILQAAMMRNAATPAAIA